MAFILADRVKETTTTTGTGDITLAGAVTGFQAFSARMSNNDTTRYAIVGETEWEVGIGTWKTGGTLTRTTVLKSTNGDAAVDFSAGTKNVFMTLDAGFITGIKTTADAAYTPGGTDVAIADGGTGASTAAGAAANLAVEIGKLLFPVGSYYINETDSTNPATLLGFGTWSAVQDVFLVGHGSTYTTTGGSASHSHVLSDNGQAQIAVTASSPSVYERRISTASFTSTHQNATGSGAGSSTAQSVGAALAGNTDSTTNVPPYQAAYIWKRTV